MLSQSGADKILKEYDGQGNVESLSFVIQTDNGKLPFRLPVNIKAVMQTINNQTGEYRRQRKKDGRLGQQVRVIPQKFYNDFDQARRVGWRILRDWLEAQLAMFFLQQVKIEEIMLPFMFNEKTGKTMFQMMEERNFKFQLEDKTGGNENE